MNDFTRANILKKYKTGIERLSILQNSFVEYYNVVLEIFHYKFVEIHTIIRVNLILKIFCIPFFTADCVRKDFNAEKLSSDDFRSLCNLVSNKDKFEGPLAEGLKYTALKLSALFAPAFKDNPILTDEDYSNFKNMITHMICIVQANAFTVRTISKSCFY